MSQDCFKALYSLQLDAFSVSALLSHCFNYHGFIINIYTGVSVIHCFKTNCCKTQWIFLNHYFSWISGYSQNSASWGICLGTGTTKSSKAAFFTWLTFGAGCQVSWGCQPEAFIFLFVGLSTWLFVEHNKEELRRHVASCRPPKAQPQKWLKVTCYIGPVVSKGGKIESASWWGK